MHTSLHQKTQNIYWWYKPSPDQNVYHHQWSPYKYTSACLKDNILVMINDSIWKNIFPKWATFPWAEKSVDEFLIIGLIF